MKKSANQALIPFFLTPFFLTTITYSATDNAGNTATATQNIYVSFIATVGGGSGGTAGGGTTTPPAQGGGATVTTEAVYWHHNDHLGTPQALTDINGTVVWTISQTPFGIATVNEDPDGDGLTVTNNFRFPGQYYDAETGLNYNYQRTYDPAGGRYTQHDPIGLNGGMNPFGYVGGNPVGQFDLFGLYAEVLIFQPVGWGGSSFGHAAININGTVYSWGPSGLWSGAFDSYMQKNNFRDAVGAILNISSSDESFVENFIISYTKGADYSELLNNCSDPIEAALEQRGFTLGVNVFPVGFAESLDNAGLVDQYNFYSATEPSNGV